jgi:hypothetical protein
VLDGLLIVQSSLAMDHSNVLPIADPSRPLSQEDSRETFYPSQTGQSNSNKMPASTSQALDSKPTAFPGPANLALESEAWLSESVSPKGPPCPLVPNVAFGSVAQPVAKALTDTAAPPPANQGAPPASTAAALPPPPVLPNLAFGSVEQPVPKTLTGTAAPPPAKHNAPPADPAAALPPPPVRPVPKPPPPAPPMPKFQTMREARDWWNDLCQKNVRRGIWITPVTQNMLRNVGWMDWPNMIKDERLLKSQHAMTRIMPTFYIDEADSNRFDRPRLDFVVEFDDGQAVRYHPAATPIWLPASADNAAIDKRRRYLAKIQRSTGGRDWYR